MLVVWKNECFFEKS